MLYGNQVLRRASPPINNADDRNMQPHELRALQYTRAAVVEASYRTRAASMCPEAEGEHPAVHTCTTSRGVNRFFVLPLPYYYAESFWARDASI